MTDRCKEILKQHFFLQTNVKDDEPVPQDNVAHFWLIYKDWPVLGTITLLDRDDFNELRQVLDVVYDDLHFKTDYPTDSCQS